MLHRSGSSHRFEAAASLTLRHLLAVAGLLAAALALATCGDSSTSPAGANTIAIQAGNNQNGIVGQAVSVAPSVKVSNSGGTGVAGISVTFSVTAGGGSITGGSATTNAQGIATVGSWTLGTAVGSNTLSAQMAGGGSVSFTATAAAGAPATFSKVQGDNQIAPVKTFANPKPSVRVADEFDNPVQGATVQFSITAGGGTVSGGTQLTNASGVATVGDWQFGPIDGANALTAALQGSALANLVFAATGQEIVLQPGQDTALTAGAINVTRLVVPAGRTVTLMGNVTINADSTVEIHGNVTGNCTGLNINGEQDVFITGNIDNRCLAPTANAPGLSIIAKSGYEIDGPGQFMTSGPIMISNDPTLTDDDFDPIEGAAALRLSAAGLATSGSVVDEPPIAGLVQRGCRVSHRPFVAAGQVDGVQGKTGTNGEDGKPWTLQCRGADLVLNDVAVFGQDGGNGGPGVDMNGDPGDATGGNGGAGGKIIVRSTNRVNFEGVTVVQSGDGGDGGDGTATAMPNKPGQKAASAKAKGGTGASPGLIEVVGNQGILGAGNLQLVVGRSGHGGDASATARDGVQGLSPSAREQDGGDSDAEGGAAGGTPDRKLIKDGNVQGGEPAVSGGNGGHGGASTSKAGNGAAGTEEKPDGGNGGAIRSQGGNAGHALLRNKMNMRFGNGGNGGNATWIAGNGADGQDNCVPPPIMPGGKGGDGGAATGTVGIKGMGMADGVDGTISVQMAGNGANGGDGEDPGTKGVGGANSFDGGSPNVQQPSFQDGVDGMHCPTLIMLPTDMVSHKHVIGKDPCPQVIVTIGITNTSNQPITLSAAVFGPNVEVLGLPSTVPAMSSKTVTLRFNCNQAHSYTTTVRFTAEQGLTMQSADLTVNGNVVYEALVLDIPLGIFPIGTIIPLANISGYNPAAEHGMGCPNRHVHAFIPLNGILIFAGMVVHGPFPEPVEVQPACGYGLIIEITVPDPGSGVPEPEPVAGYHREYLRAPEEELLLEAE